MAWDAGPFAGFSRVEPWLPLHDDWPTRNVAVEADDPRSMLSLYRHLLALRRATPALSLGTIVLRDAPAGVLAYERHIAGERVGVLLNLTGEAVALPWSGAVLASTLSGIPDPAGLRADEGLILRLPL
jgi:oligo-1,6-glucosidase/alpha-glucosidase